MAQTLVVLSCCFILIKLIQASDPAVAATGNNIGNIASGDNIAVPIGVPVSANGNSIGVAGISGAVPLALPLGGLSPLQVLGLAGPGALGALGGNPTGILGSLPGLGALGNPAALGNPTGALNGVPAAGGVPSVPGTPVDSVLKGR